MAKTSGLGDNFYVAQYNLSGDINSLGSISGGVATLDVTAINAYGNERIAGLRDGQMEFTSYFNDVATAGAAGEHVALSTLPTTDRIMSYFRGQTLNGPAASLVAKQINYDGSRADDGAFQFNVEAQANSYGLEWGVQGTAGVRTDTGATVGSAVDYGAVGLSFGLQAYLHVFAFTGTDVTVKLQESSDNSGDAYADVVGGGFTQVTGLTSERIATSPTLAVERYLKVVTTTSAGFTNLKFAVVIVRNTAAPSF